MLHPAERGLTDLLRTISVVAVRRTEAGGRPAFALACPDLYQYGAGGNTNRAGEWLSGDKS